jgi:hypothetical protein
VFLQGGFDHDGNVTGRMNQGWTANSVTKLQAQVSSLLESTFDPTDDDPVVFDPSGPEHVPN